MIKFEPGSHQYSLISILSVVGEIPTSALNLVGNARTMPDLVRRLNKRHKVIGEDGQVIDNCRILKIVGKSEKRRIRIHSSALELFDWLGEKEYYMSAFQNNKFSGSHGHIERNFRNAETVIMFTKAGIEFRPQYLPELQGRYKLNRVLDGAAFYPARLVKGFQDYKEAYKKLAFSRVVGMLVAHDEAYAVYNFRSHWDNKSFCGEDKAQQAIHMIVNLNYKLEPKASAIVIADDFNVARDILTLTHLDRRRKLKIASVYNHLYFIPKTDFGVRMLRFFCVRDFKEKINSFLYEKKYLDERNKKYEYDICKDNIYYLSILDGNIGRMERYWNFLNKHGVIGKVICYPEQEQMVRSYFGKRIIIQKVAISVIEKILDVDMRGLFYEE